MPRHAGRLPPRALAGGLQGGAVAVLLHEEGKAKEMGGAEGKVRRRPAFRRAARFRERWGGIGGGGGRAAAAAVRPQPRRRARRVRVRSLHQPTGEPLAPLMAYPPHPRTALALQACGGKRHGLAYMSQFNWSSYLAGRCGLARDRCGGLSDSVPIRVSSVFTLPYRA